MTAVTRYRAARQPSDEALLAIGPYRKSGPVAVAGPLVTPRDVLQATCAGMVYRLDPETGEAEIVASLRVPVAAPLTSVGDDVVAVDAGGTVRRFRVA